MYIVEHTGFLVHLKPYGKILFTAFYFTDRDIET